MHQIRIDSEQNKQERDLKIVRNLYAQLASLVDSDSNGIVSCCNDALASILHCPVRKSMVPLTRALSDLEQMRKRFPQESQSVHPLNIQLRRAWIQAECSLLLRVTGVDDPLRSVDLREAEQYRHLFKQDAKGNPNMWRHLAAVLKCPREDAAFRILLREFEAFLSKAETRTNEVLTDSDRTTISNDMLLFLRRIAGPTGKTSCEARIAYQALIRDLAREIWTLDRNEFKYLRAKHAEFARDHLPELAVPGLKLRIYQPPSPGTAPDMGTITQLHLITRQLLINPSLFEPQEGFARAYPEKEFLALSLSNGTHVAVLSLDEADVGYLTLLTNLRLMYRREPAAMNFIAERAFVQGPMGFWDMEGILKNARREIRARNIGRIGGADVLHASMDDMAVSGGLTDLFAHVRGGVQANTAIDKHEGRGWTKLDGCIQIGEHPYHILHRSMLGKPSVEQMQDVAMDIRLRCEHGLRPYAYIDSEIALRNVRSYSNRHTLHARAISLSEGLGIQLGILEGGQICGAPVYLRQNFAGCDSWTYERRLTSELVVGTLAELKGCVLDDLFGALY